MTPNQRSQLDFMLQEFKLATDATYFEQVQKAILLFFDEQLNVSLGCMSPEDQKIFVILKSMANVRNFLLKEITDEFGIEEWIVMFTNSIESIKNLDISDPNGAVVALKNLILQNAIVCVSFLCVLDQIGIKGNKNADHNNHQSG